MEAFAVRLLGSPVIERDGQAVRFDTRKATALLAYLAVTGQPQGRDTLAGLLWPDSDPDRSRAALRRTLSTLNAAVGAGVLRADRRTIELDRAAADVDVRRFRALVEAGRSHEHPPTELCPACLPQLEEAVALYRGDFLAGFALRDADPFDEWQFFEAEELRRLLSGGLERLVAGLAEADRHDDAIGHARRWLTLDPLHEPAHQTLMRLYAATGQRGPALRQYRECVAVLERELGVEPLDETVELFQAISEERFPQKQPSPPPAAPVRQPEREGLPHVGRGAEQAAIRAAWTAVDASGRLVVIEGEAGIGKTRLVETAAAEAHSAGAATLMARCYDGQHELAYGPFFDALRTVLDSHAARQAIAAIGDHWLAEAARLLPELAGLRPDLPLPPPIEGPGARSRFFEGLAQVLQAACSGARPGLLAIDDMQWADEATLDFVTYLVRRLEGRALLLLLTWRSEDLTEDHPLHRLVAQAEQQQSAVLIRLSRLDRAAVATLAAARLTDPADELVTQLHEATEGLPLFIVHYLEALADSSQGPHWALPAGIRSLLTERIRRVEGPARQLLATAAVIGRSFDPETLRVASGRGEEETVTGLEELLACGLVREVPAETSPGPAAYDFAHEQLRELILAQTTLARRRLLHRRIADALAARTRSDALAGRIAHHYQETGAEAEAAMFHARAARHAHGAHAHTEALAHVDAALGLKHPDPGGLHEIAGDCLTLLGDYRQALRRYEAAAALSEPERLPAIEHRLGALRHRRGEWRLAESHYAAALEGFEARGSAAELARLRADWSLTAHRCGHQEDAQELALTALRHATEAGDDRALAQANNILGILAKDSGDLDSAAERLRGSASLADRAEDPTGRVAALNNLALVLREAGQLDEALRLAEEALALCLAIGDRHRAAALHNNVADILNAAGRRDEALDHLKAAVPVFAEIGSTTDEDAQPEIWKLSEW